VDPFVSVVPFVPLDPVGTWFTPFLQATTKSSIKNAR
jgi:hypothetical protein